MRHKTTTPRSVKKPALKKETIRQLDLRPLSADELAGVAGGTYWPRYTCHCTA